MSDSSQSQGLQYSRLACPSPTLGPYSDSCALSWWCHPTISSSVVTFSSHIVFPSIRVFSKESALHIRWSKYWSFSFSISPSNEYSGLILQLNSWISLQSKGLLRVFSNTTVQKHQFIGTQLSFIVQLSHPYMTTGKTIALTTWTFVGKVMSLLYNMLPRLVIAFLSRNKHLLISWLQSPSAVILESPQIKPVTVCIISPSICHEVMGPNAMILVFWMLSFNPNFLTLLFHLHQEAL